MPGPEPPADEVDMERTLTQHIKTVLLGVPYIGQVHTEPQYPSKPEEYKAVSQVDDPVMGENHKITNVVEIGLPTVEETSAVGGGSDEEYDGLYFTYPISFSLGVVPKWDKDGFPYKSSAQMAIGIYMRARRLFKRDRTLGFANNVLHYYLQLVGQDELVNQKGEAIEHLQDWELTVRVVGNY